MDDFMEETMEDTTEDYTYIDWLADKFEQNYGYIPDEETLLFEDEYGYVPDLDSDQDYAMMQIMMYDGD